MSIFEEFESINLDTWVTKIHEDLKGKDFDDQLVWKTDEGIHVQPVYNSESLSDNNSTSYSFQRDLVWEINECIDLSVGIKQSNQIALSALKGGASSLYFQGEVSTNNDLTTLLNGIMLEVISIHFYSPNPKWLEEALEKYCQANSIDVKSLQLYVYFDPLGEALVRGGENKHLQISFETLGDNLHTVIKGIHFANAGASATQELAYSLNQAVAYVHEKTERGVELKDALNSLHFHMGIGTNFFMEIAKYRALRILWKLVSGAFGEETEVNIHAETNSFHLSTKDTHTNILRTTTGAMSAILGGCEVITISPFDAKLKQPSDFSRRIARNIQIILKEEAYFGKVQDMVKGTYYIETLTDELVKNALKLFQSIEQSGGFLSAIQDESIQKDINNTLSKKLKRYTSKESTFLGVNKHLNSVEENNIIKPTLNQQGETSYEPLGAINLTELIEQEALKTGGIEQ